MRQGGDMTRSAVLMYGAVDLASRQLEAFCDAVERLPVLLAKPPMQAKIHASRFNSQDLQAFHEILSHTRSIGWYASKQDDYLEEKYGRASLRILACSHSHILAKWARQNNPEALWGGTIGRLALVYELENPYVVWHEALHLFGASDCYDARRSPNCSCSNCLMQYEPTRDTVGDWPFLCDNNLRKVQARLASLQI